MPRRIVIYLLHEEEYILARLDNLARSNFAKANAFKRRRAVQT